MGFLPPEKLAAAMAEEEAPGKAPAPEAPAESAPAEAPTSETASKEEVVYREEAPAPESVPAEQPAPAAGKLSFKAKVYGQEEEVPVLLEDGTINPELPKRWSQAGAFYKAAEEAAALRKEIAELRAGRGADTPATPQAPARSDADRLASAKARLKDLPPDDPYVQTMQALVDQIDQEAAARRQAEELSQARAVEQARQELERTEKQIKEQYGADDEAMKLVRGITYARWNNGDMVPMDQVATEFFGYLSKAKESGVEQWKEKHRVRRAEPSAPAAAAPPASAPKAENLKLSDGTARKAALSYLEAIGQ